MNNHTLAAMALIAASSAIANADNLPADSTDFLDHGVVLPEVEAIGNANNRSNSTSLDAGMVQLDTEQLFNLPTMTGEPDIIRAFALQPGVSEGVEGFSGLYVRGGTNDQNLILLNGVPLYQISHLGGLFSSFNVEVVDNATFYKSSFPAMYGGRLSSVVDITTRKPDFNEYHGAATLGLTAGMLHLTGPIVKGRTAFDVSVRRSWFDVLSAPALAIINATKKDDGEKTIARYAFTDINARIDHRFDSRNTLHVDFYWGNDLFKFGGKDFDPDDEDNNFEQDVDKLRWGNTLVAASWNHTYNDRLKSTITAAFTRYKSTYDKESIDQTPDEREESNRTDRNRIDDISLFARWQYSRSNYNLRYGAFYTHHCFLPSSVEYTVDKPGASISSAYTDYYIRANEAGAYADFAWEPTAWLGIDAGLRVATYGIYDKWHTSVEPRFLARFTLMPGLSFKANYSRMSQLVQQVSDSYANLPTDNWMPVGKGEDLLTSDQVGGGLYYDTPDNTYSLSVEGYYKWLDGVAEVNEDYSYSLDKMQNIEYGRGNAYGGEITLSRNVGRLTGSASYGLMWANRKIPGINGGKWYPAKFDNRHKMNITLNYKVNDRIELNASWTFATGNRMTVPVGLYQTMQDADLPVAIAPHPNEGMYQGLGNNYYTQRNNVRLPAYHRLDIGASFTRQHGNGRKGVWRVGLYNAYCHMNPMTVRRREWYYGSNATRPWDMYYETFSIFPIIPNVSYTYYF